MDTELLVADLTEGLKDGFDVRVSFWLKASEGGAWQLYLALPSEALSDVNTSYRKAYSSLNKLVNPWVSVSDITLVDEASPIAKAAAEVRDRRVAPGRIWYRGQSLGGMSVNAAYIYPETRPLRLLCMIRYQREGETNQWRATVQKYETLADVTAKGPVGYSTAHWEGEQPADVKLAHVIVLVAIDPKFDKADIDNSPGLLSALIRQAGPMADEMFKSRHPEAVIEHAKTTSMGP
jgi:hypothetical protein